MEELVDKPVQESGALGAMSVEEFKALNAAIIEGADACLAAKAAGDDALYQWMLYYTQSLIEAVVDTEPQEKVPEPISRPRQSRSHLWTPEKRAEASLRAKEMQARRKAERIAAASAAESATAKAPAITQADNKATE